MALPIIIVVGLIVAAVALIWWPAIEPIQVPQRAAFDEKLIQRGAQLAALGNCAGCHTAQGGPSYAGGVSLATSFGTIYGTNITPDPDTGIGNWSEAAFRRAMREGIARDGRHLYPAFPYDHFTRVTDEDLQALYAFLMTRDPVRAEARANDLRFPLGFRPLVAGWNLLYLDKGAYRPDSSQSSEWNRGAYLAQGLGHCSACHSPRNALGAEEKRESLGGGLAEGWYAPALNAQSPSPLPWTVEQLTAYLRTGLAPRHAIAGGPMQDVVHSLGRAPEEDVRALAVYINSTMGGPTPEREARAKESMQRAEQGLLAPAPPPARKTGDVNMMQLGASVYAGACASCHEVGREISSSGALRLPLAIAVHDPDPSSLIRIIREGIAPPDGERGRWMPSFAGALTEEQITALVSYLRQAAANAPPWPDVARKVKEAASS